MSHLQNRRNVHDAIANRHHRVFFHARPIFDVQHRGALAQDADDFDRVTAAHFHPVSVHFQENTRVQQVQHDVMNQFPIHIAKLPPMIVDTIRQAGSFRDFVTLIKPIAQIFDGIHALDIIWADLRADQGRFSQRFHGFQHFLLLIAQRQRYVRAGNFQPQFREQFRRSLRGRAWETGGFHAVVAHIRHLPDDRLVAAGCRLLAQGVEL